MPEPNGEIPPTGDPRVDAALKRIWGRFRDLEDAMLVQVELEKRGRLEHQLRLMDIDSILRLQQSAVNRQQSVLEQHHTFLEDHEKAIREMTQAAKRTELLLAEMAEKVNLLFDREMKREGGPETHG